MSILPDDATLRQFVEYSEARHSVSRSDQSVYPFDFEQQLATAKTVRAAPRFSLTCRDLHCMVMGDYSSTSREYRGTEALIGPRDMPRPTPVIELMYRWDKEVSTHLKWLQKGQMPGSSEGLGLERLYDSALCIHPFADGNGRTFRLLLNHWRQSLGLPWLVFTPKEWSESLRRLQQFETNIFRPQHRWAYKE